MSVLALFRTSIFWSKNHSFLSKISKKDLYKLVFFQKNKWEKVWCLDKNDGLSSLQNVEVLHFLKLHFFWSKKSFFFYPQHQKTIFSDLISPKKKQLRKISIFGQKPWIIPLGKWPFFLPFKTFVFGSKLYSFFIQNTKKRSFRT